MRTICLTFSLFLCLSIEIPALEPILPAAQTMLRVLEGMDVDKHWLSGGIVNWKTGEPTGQPVSDSGKHTHCSQFAAAAAERFGIYLLRPPEHTSVLLANAQSEWLPADAGRKEGWSALSSGIAAQDAANRGEFVVAVYKNHDPKKSGHIAIVRPGEKSEAQIGQDGPEVIQAGGTNYIRTTLRQGFANHPKGFAEIRFYSHPTSSLNP